MSHRRKATNLPRQIGHQHGLSAKVEVGRCIAFYTSVFKEKSNKSWPEVLEIATAFGKHIEQKWPAYYREMEGLAAGAEVDVLNIVALNVRIEIAFGLFSDGCTAMAWHTEKRAFLGQNWDVSRPSEYLFRHEHGCRILRYLPITTGLVKAYEALRIPPLHD